MSIKIAVMSRDPATAERIQIGEMIEQPTLGGDAAAVALQLDELLEAISATILPTITAKADLTVEISGGVTLSAKGGVKWVFFNVGGEAKTTDTLKVTLKTTIEPLGQK